ncbi:MAG TPA: RDD family protein [Porticoccaceae bacterium]
MNKSPQRVWYFAIHGRRVGPFSEQEMAELVKSGSLRPDTLVWNPALGGWQRLAEVPALARHLDTAAPPSSAAFSEFVDYAGFWRRVAARLIDMLIGCILAVPGLVVVALLLVTVTFSPDPATDELVNRILMDCLVLVFWWLYFALQISSPRQATFGMKGMGIMVTDVDGRRVSFARATWRFIADFVFNPLTFGLGYLLAA